MSAETRASSPATIAGTSIPVAPSITGQYYPATPNGFVKLLAEANLVAREGWALVTMTRLESSIAVLYRRVGSSSPNPTQFFDPEDDGSDL